MSYLFAVRKRIANTVVKKVRKGVWRMPRLTEAMKDVISCDKLRALELLVNRFYIIDFVWEICCNRTILQLICHASLDGIEAIEHITLHHDKLSNTIHHDRILELYKVAPATTTLTTGNSTILMTEVTDLAPVSSKSSVGNGPAPTRVQ